MERRTLKAFVRKIKPDSLGAKCRKISTSKHSLTFASGTEPRTFIADFTAHGRGNAKYMSAGWKRRYFAIIQDFVDTARRLGCRRFVAFSHTTFIFAKTQKFLSFPHFPFEIEHEKGTHGLGQTQLKFVGITFRNSPLGLSRVILGSRDGAQMLELITNMQMVSTTRLPERLYTKAQNVAQLFLA